MLFTSLIIPSHVANLNTLHLFMSVPKEEKSNLLTYCCEGIVSNMEIVSNIDFLETDINKYKVFKFGTCEGINNVVNNIEVIRL